MAARALSIRLRSTRSSASGSPRTVVSLSALSVMVARGFAQMCVFDEWAHDRGEVDGCSGWVCFEAGEPEEVVDEAAESFAFAGNGCFESVTLGPFRLLAQEGLDACLEGGNWGAELVRGVGEKAAGCGVAGACFLDGVLESVDHLVECCGEAAELGVGAAGLEAELGVAVGDARGGLDDGGEGAESGAGAVEDEQGGERERGGCDQELDEKQVGDGVVDACAAGGEGDPRSVGEGLVEDRAAIRVSGSSRRSWPVAVAGASPPAGGDAGGDPLEREAR